MDIKGGINKHYLKTFFNWIDYIVYIICTWISWIWDVPFTIGIILLETIVKPGASFISFCKYKLYRLTHMKISTTIHVTQC